VIDRVHRSATALDVFAPFDLHADSAQEEPEPDPEMTHAVQESALPEEESNQ
jgi:hypothetical protein